jgi:hypothetical protein
MKTSLRFLTTKATVAAFLLCASCFTAAAQTVPQKDNANNDIFISVEQMPEYNGGEKALLQYLGQHIQYRTDQPEGLIIASFVVRPDSSVSDVEIMKGLDPELDKECIRVIESLSGHWTPGMQKGKPVAVRYTVPIKFKQSTPAPVSPQNDPDDRPYTLVENMPEFMNGGRMGLLRLLDRAVPNKEGIQELSIFSFIVERDSTISEIQLVRSVNPQNEALIIAALKETSGQWYPGTQNGKIVKVRMVLPVKFPILDNDQSPPTAQPRRKQKQRK